MKLVAIVVVVSAAAIGFAFRPALAGTPGFWLSLLVPYMALAALALYRMWDEGTLLDVLKPRWGDLSIGAVIAALLLIGSWVARSALAPAGTPRQGWVLRVYLQLGDAEAIQRSVWLTGAILLLPLCDELAWRGLLLPELATRVGTRRAWPLATLLYGAAATPTLFTLADPSAGLNPLIVTTAVGCGLFWTFATSLTGRLPPVIVSHMAFSYFSVAQFRWPGM
jgi:hypothetical protein